MEYLGAVYASRRGFVNQLVDAYAAWAYYEQSKRRAVFMCAPDEGFEREKERLEVLRRKHSLTENEYNECKNW